jgi:hypothetical protein
MPVASVQWDIFLSPRILSFVSRHSSKEGVSDMTDPLPRAVLPKTGSHHDRVAEALNEAGIVEAALAEGADAILSRIVEMFMKPIIRLPFACFHLSLFELVPNTKSFEEQRWQSTLMEPQQYTGPERRKTLAPEPVAEGCTTLMPSAPLDLEKYRAPIYDPDAGYLQSLEDQSYNFDFDLRYRPPGYDPRAGYMPPTLSQHYHGTDFAYRRPNYGPAAEYLPPVTPNKYYDGHLAQPAAILPSSQPEYHQPNYDLSTEYLLPVTPGGYYGEHLAQRLRSSH